MIKFEHFLPNYILTNVKWFKKVVAMVLLALWLPATMCCALEQAGVPLFAQCCVDDTAGTAPETPCTETGCCPLESAAYKIEQTAVRVVAPSALVLDALTTLFAGAQNLPAVPVVPVFVPPELPVTWQFFFRTALPPRAPSLAS